MLRGSKRKKGTFWRQKVVQGENRAILGEDALSRTKRPLCPESRSDTLWAALQWGPEVKRDKTMGATGPKGL